MSLTLEEAYYKEKLRAETNVLACVMLLLFYVGLSFCCLAAVVMVTS